MACAFCGVDGPRAFARLNVGIQGELDAPENRGDRNGAHAGTGVSRGAGEREHHSPPTGLVSPGYGESVAERASGLLRQGSYAISEPEESIEAKYARLW